MLFDLSTIRNDDIFYYFFRESYLYIMRERARVMLDKNKVVL